MFIYSKIYVALCTISDYIKNKVDELRKMG